MEVVAEHVDVSSVFDVNQFIVTIRKLGADAFSRIRIANRYIEMPLLIQSAAKPKRPIDKAGWVVRTSRFVPGMMFMTIPEIPATRVLKIYVRIV